MLYDKVVFAVAVAFVVFASASGEDRDPTLYNIGIGIADITGPAAEINMVS